MASHGSSLPSAAAQWQEALAAWALPEEILAQAPVPPWVHPPKLFVVADDAEPVDTPSFAAAREALGAGGSVLDVGCGGGGSSVPLGAAATSITGVDEQDKMLANFAAACDKRGIAHAEVLGRWPDVAGQAPVADVVVCHHVAYNVGDIAPFLQALTAHARRRVVVELPERHPTSPFNPLWKRFWGIDRPSEPSAELFIEVVRELGWEPAVVRVERAPRRRAILDRAEYVAFARTRLCLTPDRDPEVDAALGESTDLTVLGTYTVSWAP